jgi:hypothetical protein
VNLYDRRATLRVDTIEISFGDVLGLDLAFMVDKTIKPDPNTAEITIWNLNEEHRQGLADKAKDGITVYLEAGYKDATSVIAEGDLRFVNTYRDGPDLVTKVCTGDGDKAKAGRISKSYGLATPVATVLRDVAKACNVPVGNLETAITGATLTGAGSVYKGGTSVSGNAYEALQRLAASAGLEVSIQRGKLQFLAAGMGLAGKAYELSAETGLYGSPSVDQSGMLKAQCGMLPDLFPGRKVVMDSELVTGTFKVTRARYIGDTAGADWHIDFEGMPEGHTGKIKYRKKGSHAKR